MLARTGSQRASEALPTPPAEDSLSFRMLITDTGATPVAPAEGLPAQAECGALLRLACAHFGVDAALVVGPGIDGPAALA
ncbi:hypothetical protein, partial [Burkholderia sp. Tr-860]